MSQLPKHLLCLQILQIPSRQIEQPSALIPEGHISSTSTGNFSDHLRENTQGKELLPLTGIFDKSQLGQEPETREESQEGQLEAVVSLGVEGLKNALAPPAHLQIQNGFSALGTGDDKKNYQWIYQS